MVGEVQQGNGLFKYKEIFCEVTARKWFGKSQQEDSLGSHSKKVVCEITAGRWFVKYSMEMVCLSTTRRWFV